MIGCNILCACTEYITAIAGLIGCILYSAKQHGVCSVASLDSVHNGCTI